MWLVLKQLWKSGVFQISKSFEYIQICSNAPATEAQWSQKTNSAISAITSFTASLLRLTSHSWLRASTNSAMCLSISLFPTEIAVSGHAFLSGYGSYLHTGGEVKTLLLEELVRNDEGIIPRNLNTQQKDQLLRCFLVTPKICNPSPFPDLDLAATLAIPVSSSGLLR